MTFTRLPSIYLFLWLTALALPSAMTGCATVPVSSSPGISAAEEVGRALLHDWLAESGRHDSLQGVAKVRVQTAERSVAGTQVLMAEKPDRLRAETLSPFGTLLLVMAADGTNLGILLPGDNLFYRGRATPENFGRFARLPLHPADLVSILLAQPPVIAHRRLVTYQLPDGGWRIELDSWPRVQHLIFDAGRRLREVRYLNRDQLQLRLAYGEPGPEPQALPRRIDLDLPLQKVRASLVFEEMVTGRRSLPEAFTLVPPAGATVILLDELAATGEKIDELETLPAEPQGPQAENN